MSAPDPFGFIAADLAPGEARAKTLDLDQLQAVRVRSADDPLFDAAYAIFWEEFGAAAEVEPRDVLARRLRERRGPRLYELIAICRGEQIIALRDHQAMADDNGAVVHLSHAWIHPDFRRSGLAGWLRSLPVQLARRMAAEAGLGPDAPITLVAEMEHPDAAHPDRMIRLSAYEKAGFRKIDPKAFAYLQPDFRPPEAIDESGAPRLLPFSLIVRRVGREAETELTGGEAKRLIGSLYRLYACDFRASDMEPLWEHLEAHAPPRDTTVLLIPPTQ